MTDEIKNKKLKKPQFPEIMVSKRPVELRKMQGESVNIPDMKGMIVKDIHAEDKKIVEPDLRRDEHHEVAEMLFKLGVRNFATRNVKLKDARSESAEEKAPEQPLDELNMFLNEFSDSEILAHLTFRAASRPDFKTKLSIHFQEATAPEVEPTSTPTLALPETAPRLWADRDKGIKAAQFVRETYAPWLEAGVLTRGALKACDKALYHAYHVWVHRHPEDAVTFRDAPPSNFIADPVEAIGRYREGAKNASARYRAKRATEPDPGVP